MDRAGHWGEPESEFFFASDARPAARPEGNAPVEPGDAHACGAGRRLRCLEEITMALLTATGEDAVAEVILGLGAAALGATSAMIQVVEDEKLVVLGAKGMPEASLAKSRTQSFDVTTPLAMAVRSRAPVFIETEAERAATCPDAARAPLGPRGPCIALPLLVGERILGGMAFSFTPSVRFTEDERALAVTLGRQCALALDRARLFDAERKARAELSRAYEIAREADRRKDEFLALLGHELRNPLSPILTALYLMRLKGKATGIEREREVIERQVHHLVSLVDDLLDVSRITRGKIQLQTQPMEIARVLSRAIEIASPLFEQKRHELRVDVPATGLVVDVDETRMAQVLANLLTNAAKYTHEGGHVAVAARREGHEVVLSVRDDGIGIGPDMLPVIFDLFVQGARGADRAGGGLGLGLGLVRSLVTLHGGSVRGRSEGPGRGSEFEVRLPALSARRASSLDLPPPALPGLQRVRRVLVVDDNTDAAQMLAEVLASHGHDVRLAHDGPQALALAATFRPEVGILDIGLPVMDGYELALELRAAHGDTITLIAVTGYGQEHDKRRAFQAGFSKHYVKPVATDALLREVFP